MRYVVMLFVTFAGCGFSGSAATDGDSDPDGDDAVDVTDGDMDDADGDTPPIDGPPCESYSSIFDTCSLTHGGALVLTGENTFDTDSRELVHDDTPITVTAVQQSVAGGQVALILAESIRLDPGAVLRVVGSLPFGLAAQQTIELGDGAAIDASAGGAGARMCSEPGVGMADDGGASAGAGGGFGAAGAPGGAGDSDGGTTAGGVAGSMQPRPVAILGGCAGAAGGSKSQAGAGGRAGAGGGGIYVAARASITLLEDARITANGQGGGGGCDDCGAGGGGSGGMIFLESALVTANHLFANGGAGGKGGTSQADGEDGEDGPNAVSAAAGGTDGHFNGGNGGNGGWRDSTVGGSPEGAQRGGGGGGGGAVGYIRIVGDGARGETISPAAMN